MWERILTILRKECRSVLRDPRRKGGLKHCEQAYHEWGMKGFKLHAGVGYMPDDPVCNWVYEKATEWQIPIMCHTGGAPTVALRWENSRPAYFASAAARYPDVNFIFAHAGDIGWWREAMQAAAWMPTKASENPAAFRCGTWKTIQTICAAWPAAIARTSR